MPPIKNNPKFYKFRTIANEEGIAKANRVLNDEFVKDTYKGINEFGEWINFPKRIFNNVFDIALIGGIIYFIILKS